MSTLEPSPAMQEPQLRDTGELLEGLGIAAACLLIVGLLAWRTRSWPWHGRFLIYLLVALVSMVGAYNLAMVYTLWQRPDYREMPIGQVGLAVIAGVVVTAGVWLRSTLQRKADERHLDQE